jgi:predicted permease
MSEVRAFLLRIVGVFQRERRERELNEEFENHIALHIEDNLRAGMCPEEARRIALLKFGGISYTKEDCHNRSGLPLLEASFYDLRYAIRCIRKSPLSALVTVATLALGIGATTAMFSVGYGVLLRPLPYNQSHRLVAISEFDRRHASPGSGPSVASADFLEWQRANTVFSGVADYVGLDERGKVRVDLYQTGIQETRILKGLFVSNNLFEVLGVSPWLGSTPGPQDNHSAILSYDCWQNQFGADPHIVGQSIILSGSRSDVIGVMPRGFLFPNNEVEVFIPAGQITPDRVFHDVNVIARLRPGITLKEARNEMAVIGARLQEEYPETNASLEPRVDVFHWSLAASSRPALLMLFSAVGILFLIVCSNVAHLQLGRTASRRQEFAIRQSLGAGRARLIRQLLAESMVLSVVAGVAGLAMAYTVRLLILRFAPNAIPSHASLKIDSWVVVFNVSVTLLAPFLFGLGPALSAARNESLRNREFSSDYSYRRIRTLLVSGEVALSVVLVVCAGLFIRSYLQLAKVDLGFQTEHTLSFRLDLSEFVPSEDMRAQQFAEIEGRLLEQPGIDAAGATARPILGGGSGGEAGVTILGQERNLRLELVTPGYFLAMRTPLLQGRLPKPSDTIRSGLIAVVNSAFEREYFPNTSALGRQIGLGARGPATIVGVVADLKQEELDQPAQPAAFIPSFQIVPRAVTFVVHGKGERQTLAATARSVVHSVNKTVPLADLASLEDLVQASISAQRLRASMLSLIAAAALFLAALGIYGVLAYSVVQRSNEIGIRMALGAMPQQVFFAVIADGVCPVLIGLVFGFATAYGASRLIQSLLFGIVPADPATYLFTAVVLIAVSLFACLIPASKAIRLDPMAVLRCQ